MSEPFRVHPQLLADCHRLGALPRCEVLLHRNASVPWLILVPRTETVDLLDLPADERAEVLGECALAARYVRETRGVRKLNMGALGNVVPQLHVHVVGRREGDPCWPKPVWGNLPPGPTYSADDVAAASAFLAAAAGSGWRE